MASMLNSIKSFVKKKPESQEKTPLIKAEATGNGQNTKDIEMASN